ncbi:hypothetical protein [Mycolicibacterium tokaiense]|uniref:Uncharacterized protein n=1 Tax=Mycolicibacterium tokaiense TaxID=39695 RepID=A0A378T9L3_9MYCO|nr:hypothetical protein [Mycolicibacterium tokaiense]BBY88019.1 hypothetical protein MTOK_38010 [Mycolicibacterium tokaiense]STZ57459.1 Uncharacterised protein [Mycolicibacterium tokaiense]
MSHVQPGMNVARQRRKITQLIADAPDTAHVVHLDRILSLFDKNSVLNEMTKRP